LPFNVINPSGTGVLSYCPVSGSILNVVKIYTTNDHWTLSLKSNCLQSTCDLRRRWIILLSKMQSHRAGFVGGHSTTCVSRLSRTANGFLTL